MSEEAYSLQGRVYHTIRERILNGQYSDGEELRELTIGKELGVSRTPVREALRQLFRRMPREKPAPKDLVRALAMSVWRKRKAQDRPPVRYQLLESLYPRRFGIRGESWDPACQLVVLLYSRDRAEVEQLVQALNRDQVPLQEAQERFLCGEDLYTHS